MADLPHAFPFRWVDRSDGERAVTGVTAGAALPRQAGPWPLGLAVETMAQAALALLGDQPEAAGGRAVFLAGIQDAQLLTTVQAGDRLEAAARVVARMGPAIKVECELVRAGERVAEASLLLKLGA